MQKLINYFFYSAFSPAFLLDLDTKKIIQWNKLFEDFDWYSPEQESFDITEIFGPASVDYIFYLADEALEEKGSHGWVDVKTSALLGNKSATIELKLCNKEKRQVLFYLEITSGDEVKLRQIIYESAFDAFPGPALVLNQDGFIFDLNKEAERLYNTDRLNLYGKNLLDINCVELREGLSQYLGDEKKNRTAFKKEFSDGKSHYLKAKYSRIWDLGTSRMAIFCGISDITDLVQLEQGIAYREALLKTIYSAAHILIASPGDFPTSISEFLEMLGKRIDVERVYIWNFHNDIEAKKEGVFCTGLYDWIADGYEKYKYGSGVNVPVENIPAQWYENFTQGKVVNVSIGNLDGKTKELLNENQVKSVLLVPIEIKNQLWGFLGIDECARERLWSNEDETLLHTAGVLLSAAIRKLRIASRNSCI